MLILIFNDIQYLQEVVFSLEEGSKGQNHCFYHSTKQSPPIKVSDLHLTP